MQEHQHTVVISKGDFVKIRLVNKKSEGELFWCKVKHWKHGKIIGTVDNDLLFFDYPIGHELTIEPEDVMDIMRKDA